MYKITILFVLCMCLSALVVAGVPPFQAPQHLNTLLLAYSAMQPALQGAGGDRCRAFLMALSQWLTA